MQYYPKHTSINASLLFKTAVTITEYIFILVNGKQFFLVNFETRDTEGAALWANTQRGAPLYIRI